MPTQDPSCHQSLLPSPYAAPNSDSSTESASEMHENTPSSAIGTALRLEVTFRASAEHVYEALLDERKLTAFSGAVARIDSTEGGTFSLVGGRVTGRNVELIPNQRIVQAWHVMPWAAGIYSIVRFELHPTAEGSSLVLDHSGFAPEDLAARTAGWFRVYLDPLRKYLES